MFKQFINKFLNIKIKNNNMLIMKEKVVQQIYLICILVNQKKLQRFFVIREIENLPQYIHIIHEYELINIEIQFDINFYL